MPLARTGGGNRMPLDGEPRLSQRCRALACGTQSPGGLSEGTLTSAARKRVWLSRAALRKSADDQGGVGHRSVQ